MIRIEAINGPIENAFDDHIKNALEERGHTDADIKLMTAQEAFNEYCDWYGMTGWGPTLWDVVFTLRNSSLPSDSE